MNCRDIDRILDEHSVARITALQRAEFDAHVSGCARCQRTTRTQAVLLAEQVDGPRPGLFEAATRRAARQPASSAWADEPRRWPTLAGLGAVAVLVLVAVLIMPGIERDDSAAGSAIDATPSLSAAPDVAAATRFVEGEHYIRLTTQSAIAAPSGIAARPGATNAASSAVSVIEFFMWLCNHCYQFEFRLGAWFAEQAPDRVTVTRVPVQWNPVATLHARAFYAAELLGVADEIRMVFFEEVHDHGNTLATEAELREFFSRFGIGGDAFDDVFHSEAVDRQLERGNRLAAQFGIDSTPALIVNDAYLATPGTAGSYDDLIDVVDWLVERVVDACALASNDAGGQPRRCPADRVP